MHTTSKSVENARKYLISFKIRFIIVIFFAFSSTSKAYSQLTTFTLTAVATNETCFGNGSISFNISGQNPAAIMTFEVFKLPNLTTVVSISNPAVGLQSGNYQIVATQTLGSQSNSQTTTVEILDEVVPFQYDVNSVAVDCGSGYDITVLVLSGVAVSYEIFEGPVLYPNQSSPTFSNAPPGVYRIRVFNNCGVGSVKTYTVLASSSLITVAAGSVASVITSCSTLTASNTITSTVSGISYPLNLTYTIYPPDGSPSFTLTQNVASGGANSSTINQEMPSYNGQSFSYDVRVVDNCGGVFLSNNNTIAAAASASLSKTLSVCGSYFLRLGVSGFLAPYTVSFTSAPAGFDPVALNANHPTFTSTSTNYGNATTPVPFGIYTVLVVDACGNSATASIELDMAPAIPSAVFTPQPGCNSYKSRVVIQIPNFRILTAVIVSGPTGFAVPLDVTSLINTQGRVVIPELSNGTYTIMLTDTCGNTYPPFIFTVPDLITSVGASSRGNCDIDGLSSIKLAGAGTTLVSVIMTAAPPAFTEGTLPYDVSFNIAADGFFYMDSLPIGNYTFKVVDNCNFENIVTRYLVRYTVQSSAFEILPQCGSFNLRFDHVSNAGAPRFWLQRYTQAGNSWGHPAFGTQYIEGTLPNEFNSQEIFANATTLNLTQFGQFRIMKSFESFQSGSADPTFCWEVLHDFTFDGEFRIVDIFKLSCDGTISDIEVITNGVAPLIFRITHKNGVPFEIDNGNNNIFPALEVGFYNFSVQDACGVIKVGAFDISELPAKVAAASPSNYVLCDDASLDGQEIFNLNSLIPEIIGDQNLSELSVKFYLTDANAENDQNAIGNPSAYNSGTKTIWVRVQHNTELCYAVGSFKIIVLQSPQMTINSDAAICPDGSTTLTAAPGFNSYLWSTGATTSSIVVNQAGSYSVTIGLVYPDGICETTYNYTVKESAAPVIENISATEWTDNQNTITVILENTSMDNYEFSLDNVNFQSSNIFTNLTAGLYTIYVQDKYNCGSDEQQIYILSCPKFFTPNDDGANDFWRVRFSELEPLMETYIYDRYGKLITMFTPSSPGWDGTFKGQRVFATDYWFVVKRQDGREFKGHFALKR